MNKPIKVVWICHFSDATIRNCLSFDKRYFKSVLKSNYRFSDFAVWVSNAIKEFEQYEDIKLSVVFPHAGVKRGVQKICKANINYYCFRSEDDNLLSYISAKFQKEKGLYEKNRSIISSIIASIKPDIVHLIGAENPYYSSSLLDVPKNIPTVVSLQTLLSVPDFLENYPMPLDVWEHRSRIENKVIQEAAFIATTVSTYRQYILKNIKPNVTFLNLKLAVGQSLDVSPIKKEFDFVYFAVDICKAVDYAIEAFAIVARKYPKLTLNISGHYSDCYKKHISVVMI